MKTPDRLNIIEIQAAKPDMLSREKAATLLAHHILAATPKLPNRGVIWPWAILSVFFIAGYIMRGAV